MLTTNDVKKIRGIYPAAPGHWVGDGFAVRSMFSYGDLGRELSPFLMLDYAAPKTFSAADRQRGVGWHPHRGFETVTIALQGEIEHRDTAGHEGRIGAGDVQWMTAGSGTLHEEFHSRDFTRRGGTFEMLQLWVNLRAQDKSAPPAYQPLTAEIVPAVNLPDDGGTLRVIAGEYQGRRGPARTFTPMDVWTLDIKAGRRFDFSLPAGRTAALALLRGSVAVNGSPNASGPATIVLEREGTGLHVESHQDSAVLILSGEVIEEPIAGYGPFVMNTNAEIGAAIADFRNGRFGQIPEEAAP